MTQNTTKPSNFTSVLIGIGLPIIGALIMFFFLKGCDNRGPEKVYLTDTIRVDGPVRIDTVSVSELVKPKRIEEYQGDRFDPGYVVEGKPSVDTIPIERRDNNLLPYNRRFLWSQMGSPKLIMGKFYRDSIILVLMDTAGNIRKTMWPLDYRYYAYQMVGTDLKRFDFRPGLLDANTPALSKVTTESNIMALYSPIYGGTRFILDYSILYKRVGISAYLSVQTYPKFVDVGIGVRYKIK